MCQRMPIVETEYQCATCNAHFEVNKLQSGLGRGYVNTLPCIHCKAEAHPTGSVIVQDLDAQKYTVYQFGKVLYTDRLFELTGSKSLLEFLDE